MIESPDISGEVVWNLCLSQNLEVGGGRQVWGGLVEGFDLGSHDEDVGGTLTVCLQVIGEGLDLLLQGLHLFAEFDAAAAKDVGILDHLVVGHLDVLLCCVVFS